MPDLVIKNARIFIDNAIQPAEIAIEDGRIIKLGKIIGTQEFDLVIDAKNALILPGAIDIHVHFRDPGMTKKEDWYTGSCAAAAGGVTTVIDHPNTIPPTIDPVSFKIKQKEARKSIIDYGINAGVTQNLNHLKKLWELGATAFGEIFMAESTGALNISDMTLKEALGIIEKLDAVACIHAEDEETRKSLAHHFKGASLPEYYSKSRPPLSEKVAVEKAIKVAGNANIHFCHISAGESLDIIRKEKARNKNLTCEVAPHHLFLSTDDYKHLGTLGKMNPPLRDRYSKQELWSGLNEGTVDIIASDHAPHLETEKMTDIWSSPAGVPGVETMMPLMLMAVKRNYITLKRLLEVTCMNPAYLLGIPKGVVAQGYDADLVITGDPQEIRKEKMHSKAGWTPFAGMQGIFPKMTLSRGEIIVENGDITAKRGQGRSVPGRGFIDKKEIED